MTELEKPDAGLENCFWDASLPLCATLLISYGEISPNICIPYKYMENIN